MVCCVAGAAVMPGCRGDRSDEPPRQFFPNMDNNPRWNPQDSSEFFADGRTMRPPVDGTIAHARWGYNDHTRIAEPFNAERRDLLGEDDAFYRGRAGEGQYVERIPIPVTEELILRGQERFNIYCAACHGYAGDGQGMVGARWSTPIPSYHVPALKDPRSADGRGTDGYIFHTAMNGVIRPDGTPSMPPYGHALSPRDAWAVVAYIRVLQASHEGTLADVPPDRRQQLLREREQMPAPGEPTPGPGQTAPTSPQTPDPGTPATTPPQITNEPTNQPQSRPNP